MKLPIFWLAAAVVIVLPAIVMAGDTGPSLKSVQESKSQLAFLQNKGQIVDQYGKRRTDIDYKLETPSLSIFVGDGQIHYQWYKGISAPRQHSSEDKQESAPVTGYRMDVMLVGANIKAPVVESAPQPQYFNYYLSQCPDGATVRTYSRITYKDIYPNIDWVLYTNGSGLKYDFVVRAGGKASDIKLRYDGATSMSIKDGAFTAATPMGSITEDAPYTYDRQTGKPLVSSFALQVNTLSFNVESCECDFVIDPSLKWATYFGGSMGDQFQDVATDTSANAIALGATNSLSNIATTGAHQTVFAGGVASDLIVAKFTPSGSLSWATYYGGERGEYAGRITTAVNGDIYFGGSTDSSATGIATAGAFQTVPRTGFYNQTAFLVKLNGAGVRQWGTYYCGLGASGVVCDPTGNVYIGGATNDTFCIATTGAFMSNISGVNPGFLAKFNSSGVRQWSTYYPAPIEAIKIDGSGDLIIGGLAHMPIPGGLATTGAHQTSSGGAHDCFIAKFTASGSRLWGTLYGGNDEDYFGDLALDPSGNIYIGGQTRSTTGMATTGAFISSKSAGSSFDGFIAKFNSSGVRQWGTYFYQDALIEGVGVAVDGNLYVGGQATSLLGTTTGAIKTTNTTATDLFLASFSLSGSRNYTTYYGGTGYEETGRLACSNNGKIYLAGITNSTSGIATSGAYMTSKSGNYDGALIQFETDVAVYINPALNKSFYCKGDTIKVDYKVTQSFNTGNIFTLQLSNASGDFSSPTTITTLTATSAGTLQGLIPLTIPDGAGYRVRIAASNPSRTSLDNAFDITIRTYPTTPNAITNAPLCSGNVLTIGSTTNSAAATYAWTGPNGFSSNVRNASINNATIAATGDYIISAELNGCIRRDTVFVTVTETPAGVTAASNSPVCSGTSLSLTASSTTPGVSYTWTGPGFTATAQNPTVVPQMSHNGSFTVTAFLGNCSAAASTQVSVNQSPHAGAYASPGDTICTFSTATFVGFANNAGAPVFQWYKNGVAIPGATNSVYTSGGFSNGDQMLFELRGSLGCNQPVRAAPITLTVLNMTVTPTVTVTADPSVYIRPGTSVTFSAAVQHGGPIPKFQWKKNGNNVGLNTASYTDNTLMPGDAVTVELTSNHACAQPANVTATPLYIWWPLSVEDNNENTTLSLYPSPAQSVLMIVMEGDAKMKDITVMNHLGQIVYRTSAEAHTTVHTIDVRNLPNGHYILRVNTTTGNVISKQFDVLR